MGRHICINSAMTVLDEGWSKSQQQILPYRILYYFSTALNYIMFVNNLPLNTSHMWIKAQWKLKLLHFLAIHSQLVTLSCLILTVAHNIFTQLEFRKPQRVVAIHMGAMDHDRFTFTRHLLLFLLVCADSANSQVHYYITPSLSFHCPGDPCLTLPQFAADSTSHLGSVTNISLTFLPGSHSLGRELSISHAGNFSMTKDLESTHNRIIFVECGNQLGRFNISETMFANIL